MSQSTNHAIDISELSYEERKQLFLVLLEDISLINVLSSEKRHKLYTELITIEPSLAGSSLDARSAVNGTTNEQNDLRNRAASRLTRGEPMSHQQKGIVEEIIKDFKEANPTFPVSEANFIFREWLALYCNSTVDQAKKKKIADAKEHGLPLPQPKKKNIKPPNNKKRNMSDSITGSLQASGSTSTIILPTPISKANALGTEDPPSPTPGEVNTSETEDNALHITPVMDKIAETSNKKRKRKSSQTPVKTPKTSRITRSSSKKTD
ncbi:15267_t:CDS:2, partial [Rhizophagus irregularis]